MLKLRSMLTAAAFATVAIAGTIVDANAQDRTLWLYEGDTTSVQGYFEAGEVIYGSCDDDCYDLDLFLYNTKGDLVYYDTELDAIPVVVAPTDGTFMIEVSMPDCSHSEGCAVWVSSDLGF
ncbi:MAG: hypothetical protein AAFZ80_11825 [Cyanobacteria bacterium P01_A01_bin.105]